MTSAFPDSSMGNESACNTKDTGDVGLIPGSRKFPGKGNGNPLQYSCLKAPMGRGNWWVTVQRVTKSLSSVSPGECTLHEDMELVCFPPHHFSRILLRV